MFQVGVDQSPQSRRWEPDEDIQTTIRTSQLDRLSFPTPIDGPDIRAFEESNDVSVVILEFDTTFSFGTKKEFFHLLHVPSWPEGTHVVHLLYLHKSGNTKSTLDYPVVAAHNCLIKNLSRLLSSQMSKREHARKLHLQSFSPILTLQSWQRQMQDQRRPYRKRKRTLQSAQDELPEERACHPGYAKTRK